MTRLTSILVPHSKVIAIGVLVLIWLFLTMKQMHRDQKFDLAGDIKAAIPADKCNASIPQTSPATVPVPIKEKNRPLVIYIYAESDNARANLEFFIKKGLHGAADFVFVFNGGTNATKLIPYKPNIEVIQRDNSCFDLGAIGEVLLKDGLWKKYKRFITLNASIRGPFFPIYSSNSCWTDVFLDRVTEHVKLVGTTFNCEPRPHLQSMLFATDDVGMSILLNPTLATSATIDDYWGTKDDPVGFTQCYETLKLAVHSEVGITELIRSQGYEVDSFLTAFHAATPETYCEVNGDPRDILYDHRYYGANVHPYETVFIKANRDIDPTLLENMTKWHLSQNNTSWDSCGVR